MCATNFYVCRNYRVLLVRSMWQMQCVVQNIHFFQKNTPDNKKDENYLTGNYCCVVDVLESYLKKIEMKVSNQKTRKML